jgi:hypothetical protein
MSMEIEAVRPHPKAFLSYAWESDAHKAWARDFATRLRADGVEITLDQWELHPGDALPEFMERAVRENDYVLIVCTPYYAQRSNERRGGVGYEGDIMTAEVLTTGNHRKFIPVYRAGDRWEDASPTWLLGAYRIDLRGDPYSEGQYEDLTTTLHGSRPVAPSLGSPPKPVSRTGRTVNRAPVPEQFQPIRILGIVVDEIGKPLNDGSRGSALYRVPFQLSGRPSHEWADVFIEKWNRPRQFTSMHRPGIARIGGDKVYLEGTTVEEVEQYHRDTLKLAIDDANKVIAEYEIDKRASAERERKQAEEHEQSVREAAKRIRFD